MASWAKDPRHQSQGGDNNYHPGEKQKPSELPANQTQINCHTNVAAGRQF